MTVYMVIEKYDNGEEYEDRRTHAETIKLCPTKEKAINYIKEIEFPVNEREQLYSNSASVKRWNVVKELDNSTDVYYESDSEEVIRTVGIIKCEIYKSSNGEECEWEDDMEYYQYTIREMEMEMP